MPAKKPEEPDGPRYQLSICPSCPSDAEQELLFAVNDYEQPVTECGRIVAYQYWWTLSLFRCQRCNGTLLYSTETEFPGPFYLNDDTWSDVDPEEVVELTAADFLRLSTLLWPTLGRLLPSSVPKNVCQIYDRALKVRAEPNSFAVQIRRALEAICIDRGEPGRNLHDDLENLSKPGVFPPVVAEIAHALRDVENTGAHVKTHDVEDKQVQALDGFFHLVVNYVYEAPAKLESYRKLLHTKTKYKPVGGSIIVS